MVILVIAIQHAACRCSATCHIAMTIPQYGRSPAWCCSLKPHRATWLSRAHECIQHAMSSWRPGITPSVIAAGPASTPLRDSRRFARLRGSRRIPTEWTGVHARSSKDPTGSVEKETHLGDVTDPGDASSFWSALDCNQRSGSGKSGRPSVIEAETTMLSIEIAANRGTPRFICRTCT